LRGFGYELSHDQAWARRCRWVDCCLLAGRSAARESAGGNKSSNDYASTTACWSVQFYFGTKSLSAHNFHRERYFPSASQGAGARVVGRRQVGERERARVDWDDFARPVFERIFTALERFRARANEPGKRCV